jgi:proton glutamate symport protein
MALFIEEVCSEEKTKVSLAWQILLALVLGILLGSYLHYHAESRDWLISNLLTPAGDIFIHLIKMIVVPIVISTLVVGIAGVGDAKQLGRIGAKTIIYFEVITTVAIVLGITLANVFQPGSGIDMSQLAAVDISKYQNTTAEVQSHAHGLMGTILSLVPTNIVASMAKGDMLPIIFFSVLFGLGLSSLPATHREPLVTVFRSISETMFKVTHMVMRYAPVGRVRADFGDRGDLRLRLAVAAGEAGDSGLFRDSVLRAGGIRHRGAGVRTEHLDPDPHSEG